MLNKFKSFLGISPVRSVQKTGSTFFYAFGQPKTVHETITTNGQMAAYFSCAPVNGIINRKARAFANAKWWLLDKDGNEAKGTLATSIQNLITKPNPLQTWGQLCTQAKVYEQIFGECFIFAITPVGFNTKEKVKTLWVLPNWMLKVKYSGKLYMQSDIAEIIEGYELTTASGTPTPLERDSVIHIKDTNQNLVDTHLGQSRLTSLQDPVSNIIAAYEARNTLITKKGALGILSNTSKDAAGTIPLKPGEKEDVQEEFKKYGLSKEQWQVIVTNANLKWQSMTFPTRDLMLFEEIQDDVRQIADNYDYPMYLLGFKEGSTFNNVSEAKKSLYQDTIIPESEGFAEALNRFFGTTEKGIRLTVFFDHLDVFQQSEREKAEAFKVKNEGFKIAYELGIVTLQEWRVGIDYEADKFLGNTFHYGDHQTQ